MGIVRQKIFTKRIIEVLLHHVSKPEKIKIIKIKRKKLQFDQHIKDYRKYKKDFRMFKKERILSKGFTEKELLGHEKIKNRMKEDDYYNHGWIYCKELGKIMSEKNNSNSICPHCQKSGQHRAMKRWHYDNCKKKLE